MKTNEPLKMKADEAGFLTALIVLELLILPALPLGKYGGGAAMFAVGLVGIPGYFILFRERLRCRGQLKASIVLAAISALVGIAVVVLLLLFEH